MLHARGDVSPSLSVLLTQRAYAPRTWRCFCGFYCCWCRFYVCSTHVEMFQQPHHQDDDRRRMLHARGDVSPRRYEIEGEGKYAPRTWRCFQLQDLHMWWLLVCSTHVEMFLEPELSRIRKRVCSTHVEMFLPFMTSLQTCRSMLHARGDVSVYLNKEETIWWYAPRTWRCFCFSSSSYIN